MRNDAASLNSIGLSNDSYPLSSFDNKNLPLDLVSNKH